jgi:hypothetical protein
VDLVFRAVTALNEDCATGHFDHVRGLLRTPSIAEVINVRSETGSEVKPMKVLIVDSSRSVDALTPLLTPLLRNFTIESASPAAHESPQTFANRILTEMPADWGAPGDVIIAQANTLCSAWAPGSFPGLDVLEHLFSEKPAPAIVLSFVEKPIRRSISRRLTDRNDQPLLNHPTLIERRLPIDISALARLVIAASTWRTTDNTRAREFKAARGRMESSVIRHRRLNLRAALRMLDGISRLGLLTLDEFSQIIGDLKTYHPSAATDLSKLQSETIDEIVWAESRFETASGTKRVLLIDDEAESSGWRRIISPACRSLGAELDWAITPDQGETKLQDPWDAVILDLNYLNVDDPPDAFQVLSRAREANPFVPIIIFTTVKEGRLVRDLSKNAFHYLFKEADEGPGAKTELYAEKFRDVLKSALDQSLAATLRGIVHLIIQTDDNDPAEFDRARDLLESAANSIMRPEVALSLTTGAIMESKFAVRKETYGAPWEHLENLFTGAARNSEGMRKELPVLVRHHRNYASHYEEKKQPDPTEIDALIYLLSATQFVADLRTINAARKKLDRLVLASTQRRDLPKLCDGLGRVARSALSLVESPIVFDSSVLKVFDNLDGNSERDLRRLAEKKYEDLSARLTSTWQRVGGKIRISKGEKKSPFADLLEAWLGVGAAGTLPEVDWESGQEFAPYLFYACIFFMLERTAQLSK